MTRRLPDESGVPIRRHARALRVPSLRPQARGTPHSCGRFPPWVPNSMAVLPGLERFSRIVRSSPPRPSPPRRWRSSRSPRLTSSSRDSSQRGRSEFPLLGRNDSLGLEQEETETTEEWAWSSLSGIFSHSPFGDPPSGGTKMIFMALALCFLCYLLLVVSLVPVGGGLG